MMALTILAPGSDWRGWTMGFGTFHTTWQDLPPELCGRVLVGMSKNAAAVGVGIQTSVGSPNLVKPPLTVEAASGPGGLCHGLDRPVSVIVRYR